MELKKLYNDAVILCKGEIPLYAFLLYVDAGVRHFLSRYPKKLLLPHGEYVSPTRIGETLALDAVFYNALLYFVVGNHLGEDVYISRAAAEGEDAYKTLWRASARGKRMKGDRW